MDKAFRSLRSRAWSKPSSIWALAIAAAALLAIALAASANWPRAVAWPGRRDAANIIGVVGAIIVAKPALLVLGELLVAAVVRASAGARRP